MVLRQIKSQLGIYILQPFTCCLTHCHIRWKSFILQVVISITISFEPDVACSVSVIPLPTQAVLFITSGWATAAGRLFGPKVGNSIMGLSQGLSDILLHWESNQGFATFRLLARCLHQLSYAAVISMNLYLNIQQKGS